MNSFLEAILVVDDNRQLGDFIANRLLPDMGYRGRIVYNGKAAIEAVRASPPALILLDLELPDTKGLDILRQLAALGFHIPTILFTAHGSEYVAAEAFRLGVQDYLVKPVEPEQLEAAISRALSETRLRQDRDRLNDELTEQVTWLSTLVKVGQSVTSSLDLENVLRRIVEAAVQLTQAEEGFIALLDQATGQLFLRAVKNIEEQRVESTRMLVEDPLVGMAIHSGVPVRRSSEKDDNGLKISTGFLVHSLLYFPIFSKGRPLGVLAVDNRSSSSDFQQRDEGMLASLVDYAAAALENVYSYEQARREIAERRRAEAALRESEARLRHAAFTEQLTQLPNRAHFMQRLKGAVQRANQSGALFAVLYLDLDRFKFVNDSLGHPAGDQLLISVAEILKRELRPDDLVARLGGDEFVLLLESIPEAEYAIQVARRIIQQLSTPIFLERYNTRVTTSASVGIVLSTLGYQTPDDVLRDADVAMYAAKAQGKSTYELYNPEMRAHILRRAELEADLMQAIDLNQLRMFYQPLVALRDGRLIGFEALVQWDHPRFGLLPAREFITIAQEAGLIVPINWWVFGEAGRQAQAWHAAHPDDPPVKVFVNLTSSLIAWPDLLQNIHTALEDTHIDPHLLGLEIKETIAAANAEVSRRVIHDLRQVGIEVQIDNFGTGESSLLNLKRFTVDGLNIDQVFIQSLNHENRDTALVRMMVAVAHEFGLRATAKGIETLQQCRILTRMGCDVGQGFLFSPLLNPEAASQLIGESRSGSTPLGQILLGKTLS